MVGIRIRKLSDREAIAEVFLGEPPYEDDGGKVKPEIDLGYLIVDGDLVLCEHFDKWSIEIDEKIFKEVNTDHLDRLAEMINDGEASFGDVLSLKELNEFVIGDSE